MAARNGSSLSKKECAAACKMFMEELFQGYSSSASALQDPEVISSMIQFRAYHEILFGALL